MLAFATAVNLEYTVQALRALSLSPPSLSLYKKISACSCSHQRQKLQLFLRPEHWQCADALPGTRHSDIQQFPLQVVQHFEHTPIWLCCPTCAITTKAG